MRRNSLLRALLGLSCVLVAVVLCGTQPTFGAALWTGSASNDFNYSSNWVNDDSLAGPKNPANANLYLYKTGAGHLTDAVLTADLTSQAIGMADNPSGWGHPTSAFTLGGDYTLNLTGSGLGCSADMPTLTINSKLMFGDTQTTDVMEMDIRSPIIVNGDVTFTTRSIKMNQPTGTLTFNGDVAPNGRHLGVPQATVIFGEDSSWTVHAYDGDTYTGSIDGGGGNGTLNFNGTLKADVADAAAMSTGSWSMIGVNTTNYGGTFAVTLANGTPFTNNGGVWTYCPQDGRMWTFDQATGVLTLGVPEPGAIVLLSTALIGLLAYAWRKRR